MCENSKRKKFGIVNEALNGKEMAQKLITSLILSSSILSNTQSDAFGGGDEGRDERRFLTRDDFGSQKGRLIRELRKMQKEK